MQLTQRVSCLQHEPFDDPMEDDAIVVAVARMRGEVLNGAWALIWEQAHGDVTPAWRDDAVKV